MQSVALWSELVLSPNPKYTCACAHTVCTHCYATVFYGFADTHIHTHIHIHTHCWTAGKKNLTLFIRLLLFILLLLLLLLRLHPFRRKRVSQEHADTSQVNRPPNCMLFILTHQDTRGQSPLSGALQRSRFNIRRSLKESTASQWCESHYEHHSRIHKLRCKVKKKRLKQRQGT